MPSLIQKCQKYYLPSNVQSGNVGRLLSSLIEFPPSIFCSSQIDDLQYRVSERERNITLLHFRRLIRHFVLRTKTRRPKLIAPDHFSTREDTSFAPPLLLHPLLQHNIKTRGRGGKRKGGVGRRRNSPICSIGFVAQTLTSTFPFLCGNSIDLCYFFWGESHRTFREKVITPAPSPPCNPRIGGGGMGEMLTILASSSGDDIRFSFPDERASLSFFPLPPEVVPRQRKCPPD